MSFVDRLTATHEGRKTFERERVIFEITELIAEAMEERNLNKSDLAKILKVSKSYVTQLLSGHENMTLAKVSDVLFELGKILQLQLVPERRFQEVSKIEFQNPGWLDQKFSWPHQPVIVADDNFCVLKMAG